MHAFLKRGLTILAASFIVAAATATGQDAAGYFDLEISVKHGSELLGQPRLLVEAGEEAEIRVEDGSGGYRLTAVARNRPWKEKQPAVEVSMTVSRLDGGEWKEIGRPSVVTRPGKTTSVDVGDEGGNQALTLELKASPVSLEQLEQLRREWHAAHDND